jgi:deoxyadenosine/deoxycytidine kinase
MSAHSRQIITEHIIELDRTRRRREERELDEDSAGGSTHKLSTRRYIAVSGNIGSGKSSLVEFLCGRYSLDPYFEPNDHNPYLADFYEDMERWSFASQIYFLTAKFRLHQELDASPRNVIQDRTIWEDAEIFAANLHRKGLMDERDWRTYRLLYESIRDQIKPPDLMIYLQCPVSTVRRRIEMRGRQMEQNIPTAYLERLHGLYEGWIEAYDLSPLVIIPTDKLDYITDMVDRHDIMKTIEKYL